MPWARSVVVHDGVLVHVGDDEGARPHLRSDTVEVDLGGAFLMPGFIDAHDHLIGGALSKMGVSLEELSGKEAVLEAVRHYAQSNPQLPVIRGHGWTPFTFGVGVQPHRSWLDSVTDVRPAMLHTYDVHDVWANTAAFVAAGIDASSVDPRPPASRPRDPDGFPSGTCCEPEAWLPIAVALGMFSVEAVEEAMKLTYFSASAWGITTAFDASPIVNSRALISDIHHRLMAIDRDEGLPVRLVCSHVARNPDVSPEVSVSRLRELHHDVRSANLSVTTLKLFMDGVGPQHTAALLEPYTDRPSDRGDFIFDRQLAARHVSAANREGFDAHMHACGDGGVRAALDAVELSRSLHGLEGARNTICHLELCNVDDVARFRELDVIANGTPIWGTDYRGEFLDAYPLLIGHERFARDYTPYGSLVKSGAMVTFGADCPGVELHEIPPLVQLEAAVTRQRPGRPDDRVCGAHERVALEEAIKCYTINGAFALRLEDRVGSLEVGKSADMVVLGRNPFEVDPHEIHSIEVRSTMMGGRFTHGAP